jgi:hypothetical protein
VTFWYEMKRRMWRIRRRGLARLCITALTDDARPRYLTLVATWRLQSPESRFHNPSP